MYTTLPQKSSENSFCSHLIKFHYQLQTSLVYRSLHNQQPRPCHPYDLAGHRMLPSHVILRHTTSLRHVTLRHTTSLRHVTLRHTTSLRPSTPAWPAWPRPHPWRLMTSSIATPFSVHTSACFDSSPKSSGFGCVWWWYACIAQPRLTLIFNTFYSQLVTHDTHFF